MLTGAQTSAGNFLVGNAGLTFPLSEEKEKKQSQEKEETCDDGEFLLSAPSLQVDLFANPKCSTWATENASIST